MRRKLVITGGPSGGKTTLIESIQRDLWGQVGIVPEAASILFKGGFPRKNLAYHKKHSQRAIYYTQAELEALVEQDFQNKMIVCDRGSLDGHAYWPEDGSSFFQSVNTSLESELSRYDWVLHLDTAPESHYDTSNPIRTESYAQAKSINEKILQAWSKHANHIVISHQEDFFSKMNICMRIIKGLAAGKEFKTLMQALKVA